MKPTLYLDVDDSLLYHPVLYNFINRCCKMNNGEYEINQKENTLKNTCNLFKDNYKLPIDKNIISRLIKLSDKVNLAIVEDAVVENHMFNYIDEEGIELLINSPIKFVPSNQIFCNGIKLTTRCDKILDNHTACSILFLVTKEKEWNNINDVVNIPNVYVVHTFDEVVELINFFADNMEFISYE